MKVAPTHPMGTLTWITTPAERIPLSRQAKSGTALWLAPGLYAVGATLSAEEVTRHHLTAIVARYWPDGVLCGRTALAGGVVADGQLFVAHPNPPRRGPLTFPGVTVRPVVGPGPLPGDMSMPNALSLSGPARVLVENVVARGRPGAHQGGLVPVEDRIDEGARSGGAGRIQEIHDQLDIIAVHFDPAAVSAVRDRLRLARPPAEISLADVIRSLVGTPAEVRGQQPEGTSYDGPAEHLRAVWLGVRAHLESVLDGVTIDRIVSGDLPDLPGPVAEVVPIRS